jgi:hypothetical protein
MLLDKFEAGTLIAIGIPKPFEWGNNNEKETTNNFIASFSAVTGIDIL